MHVCLSDICLSVAYIGLKSRTGLRKLKLAQLVHVTRDSDTTCKVKRSRSHTGAGHIVVASRTACYAPAEGTLSDDARLTSVCLTSVAYIGPKSRTDRPMKTKIGTEVAHVTRDSDTTFKVKRLRSRARRGHIVAASRAFCVSWYVLSFGCLDKLSVLANCHCQVIG